MVDGNASAAHAVQKDRNPQPLGELAELVLGPRPVEAGAGHDHRALSRGEQLGRSLDPLGGGDLGDRSGGDLGIALHEDDVERIVEEGRAGRRRRCAMSMARAVASPIRAVSLTVSADLVSGETNGR